VEATVADYFVMWTAQLRGEEYSKSEHRRALQRLLANRNDSSVERKRSNISAVLIDLNLPYLSGYKPLFNYQWLLFEVVSEHLHNSPDLLQLVAADVRRDPAVPTDTSIIGALVELPDRQRRSRVVKERTRPALGPPVNVPDYLALEARNSRLGSAGEEFVLRFERARLASAGKAWLADRIEQVSVSRGDAAGFDILSFDESGRECLIEVKTTRYGMYTPFFVSRNELDLSKQRELEYRLYRVFEFRASPKVFVLAGALQNACDLDPVQYVARVA
jgi:hypothetical protein